MKRRPSQLLLSVLSLGLFGIAVWVLHGQLQKYPPSQIESALAGLSGREIFLAGLLTLGCHWMLTFYDWLAFRYVGEKIGYGRVTFAAFLAYTFGNNIGMANFAGAAVRYRIYSRWGIRAGVIAEVIGLDVLSNWLGFFTTSGLVFTLLPPAVPRVIHLPFSTIRPFGVLLLAAAGAYFLFGLVFHRPIRIGRRSLPVPRGRIFLLQWLIGCLDFAFGGSVLFALLPHPSWLTYPVFLGIYLLAQLVTIVSHVPGGLGVFETVVLVSLVPPLAGPAVISALLAYRVIYFFLPLTIAMGLLAAFELSPRPTRTSS